MLDIYKRIQLGNGSIYMDVPNEYNQTYVPTGTNLDVQNDISMWKGANGEFLSVQILRNARLDINNMMQALEKSVKQIYGDMKTLAYYRRDAKGFRQIMSENELLNNNEQFFFVMSLLEKDDYFVFVYQRTSMTLKDDNIKTFRRIINSVGASEKTE